MSSDPNFTCCSDGSVCDCKQVPAKTQAGPHEVKWEEGDKNSKWICQCGQSKNYPYCDGSHTPYNQKYGTKISPLEVKNEDGKPKSEWVCGCGHSKTKPFCDGTHNNLKPVVTPAATTTTATPAASSSSSSTPAAAVSLLKPYLPYISGAVLVAVVAGFAIKKYHSS